MRLLQGVYGAEEKPIETELNLSMDIERFKKELKLMSSGERHLAKFFAGI